MIFKLRHETRGGRSLVSIFVGPDEDHLQSAGHLVLSVDEYELFVVSLLAGAATFPILRSIFRAAHPFADARLTVIEEPPR